MGVNLGAFFAPLVTGFLAQSSIFKDWLAAHGFDPAQSWHWGFAAAGVGMTLGLVIFVRRRELLAEVGRPPAEVTATWTNSLLVIAGTFAVMGLTVLSDDPRFQWLRAFLLLVPAAAVVWFARNSEHR